jgi:hypothetical protein
MLNTAITPTVFTPFFTADPVGAVAFIADTPYLILGYEINTNCHGATDTATFTMPISTNPDFTHILKPDTASTATDNPIYVMIHAGYPQTSVNDISSPSMSGLLHRFLGILDQYSATFEADTVTFTCRSLAAPLTTERIQATFGGSSVTTTQFVQAMAIKYGLTWNIYPNIPALTVQQVLANELQAGIHTYPVWDLLLRCAVQDDVDVWVDSGGTLWYYPSDQIPRTNISLIWGRDIQTMNMSHGIQFMKNVEVRIHSYLTKTKTATTSRAFTFDGITTTTQTVSKVVTSSPIWGTTSAISTSTNSLGVSSTTASTTSGGATEGTLASPANYSGKQVYERWVKAKNNAECEAIAKAYYRQILLHEYAVSLRVPVTRRTFSTTSKAGTVARMGITAALVLSGAPYDGINATLWPRQIREVFNPSEGWYWEIEANRNPPAQGGV